MFNKIVNVSFNSFNLLSFIIAFGCSITQAAIPNTDHSPTSYVGTTAKGSYSNLITDTSAFSVLGEAGPRNFRAGGTLGWLIQENQRLKISAEFLRQDIVYSFFSGDTRQWVNQGALGAYYQYDWYSYRYLPDAFLSLGYSHAPNKQLSTITGTYVNQQGVPQNFVDIRRIAGSDAGYFSSGMSIQPWHFARAGAALNYDHVQYNKLYPVYRDVKGVGGTAYIDQRLGDNTSLGASVGVRAPFNAYQANLAYTPPSRPNWTFGVDGTFVDGKYNLPNTYNIGIRVSYVPVALYNSMKPIASLDKDGISHSGFLEKEPLLRPTVNDLKTWVADPAIYLPQVLAITDENVTITPMPSCTPPILVGVINDQTVSPDQSFPHTVTVPTAGAFSSTTSLTYSMTTTSDGVSSTVSIDSSTGVVTIIATGDEEQTFTVTVTATNSCGSVSTTFTVTVSED